MATETGAFSEKQMQKLARMELFGVPRFQTAAAFGVSESRISQLIDSDEYKRESEKIASQNFERNELINKGWDGIEALGIRRVVDALQNDPEPEFALRAATLANKATRRGSYHNTPISQTVGVRAIVQLNATFVNKLQQNFNIEKRDSSALLENPKASDFLGAKAVQDLLKPVQQPDLLSSFTID